MTSRARAHRRTARSGPTPLSPTPPGTIASHLDLDKARLDRTFRRRRLGVLAAASLVVLGIGAAFQPGGGDATIETGGEIAAQSADAPVTLSAIVAETTSTLLEATTTTSTTVPETTTTEAPTTTVAVTTTEAPTTTAPPTTEAPATTEAPPVTAAAAPAPTAPPAPPATSAPATTQPSVDHGATDPRGTQVWLDLAQCESGGNWSINTGNGYYGGLQFGLGAWQGVGGTGYPHEHTRSTQIEMGRKLQAQYGWGAWPHCSSQLGLR